MVKLAGCEAIQPTFHKFEAFARQSAVTIPDEKQNSPLNEAIGMVCDRFMVRISHTH